MSVKSQKLAAFEAGKQALQILIADTADSDVQLCGDLITAFEQLGINVCLVRKFSTRSL